MNRPILFIDTGHLLKRDQNYGLPVTCFICDAPHKARGLARIRSGDETTHVPLCKSCRRDRDVGNVIARRFLGTPDLIIEVGWPGDDRADHGPGGKAGRDRHSGDRRRAVRAARRLSVRKCGQCTDRQISRATKCCKLRSR